MMKRITALVLAFIVLCSLSTAFAWSCPSCGSDMDGKFCTECGTKKPELICPTCGTNFGEQQLNFCTECGTKLGASVAPVPTATPAPTAAPTATPEPEAEEPSISYASQTSSGAIGILWSPQEGMTYTMKYVLRQSDDPWADSAANGGFNVVTNTGTAGLDTNSRIVPGADYWLGLFDEDGRGHYAPFESDPTGTFADFECTAVGKPQREVNGEAQSVQALSVEEINNGTKVGLFLAMSYNNPGEEKEYTVHLVLEAPNGSRWPKAAKVTFRAETSSLAGWNFLDLTEYFAALKAGFGKVEAGEYKAILYLNLNLVGSVPFQVQENAAAAEEATATTAPTEAPADDKLRIMDLNTNADSTLTVTWIGGEAPYTVRYAEKRSDDYYADLENPTSFGSWTSTNECEDTDWTLNRLVPGAPYWITVLDKNGNGQYIAYTPEPFGVFDEFTAQLNAYPRFMEGETKTYSAFIPTDKAGLLDDSVSYGGQIYITYDNPGEAREMLCQLVLTLPNGATRVEKYGMTTVDSGTDQWLGWNFCDLESYFERVRANFDAIPEGDLMVDFYLDGKLVGSATMPMQETKQLKVTRVTDNGNGTHLLTWEDNGNGPYEVIYWERFTEDMTADKEDERGTSRWRDVSACEQTEWTLAYLIPGKSYWITVTDSLGTQGVISYDVPAAGAFDMAVQIESTPRKEVDGEYVDVKGFSAATLNQDYTERYGLYINVTYPHLSEDVQMQSNVVLTLPNGAALCIESVDLTWYAECFHWKLFCLDWSFAQVKRLYGGMLEGEYRLDLYAEGNYAGGTTFYVGK